MSSIARRLPHVFLAFSDPLQDLSEVKAEAGAVQSALRIATATRLIGQVIGPPRTLTLDELKRPFQEQEYRGRIAVFHYGGHGSPSEILLEGPSPAGQAAHAGGFAQFLSTQFSLKLVFLNACSTWKQADALLHQAGVDVVIATSQRIRDDVARKFAEAFYEALAKDLTVRAAFDQAAGLVQMEFGTGPCALIRPEVLPHAGSATPADPASLRALVWGDATGGTTGEPDVWPWDIFPREKNPDPAAWKLSDLAEDPTHGLPPLPRLDFPPEPYPGFRRFTRQDARAFFGRHRYIRDLYEEITSPDTAPIFLVFGASGVGKSSLLAAGLVPRLERSHESIYKRLDEQAGSISELWRSALGAAPGQNLLEAWKTREAGQKPVVILLDQVEEVFQARAGGPTTAPEELRGALESIFQDPANRPRGKLVLSFTQDRLAEVKQILKEAGLAGTAAERFLRTLSRDDVLETVRLSPALRRHYRLNVEPGPAGLIADELTREPGVIIAPTLQILLAEMWELAAHTSQGERKFTRELFWEVQRKGYRLSEFLDRQMRKIESWNKSVAASGLLLDLLAAHATPSGRASECTVQELRAAYAHQIAVLHDLIERCKTLYLLVDPAANPGESGLRLRLAHDTLAPLVRELYEASPAPGQQARRILETRAKDWRGSKSGPPLDEADLAVVDKGRSGMRSWTPDERRLVEASRKQRRNRRLWGSAIGASLLALALIVAAGGVWEWHRRVAENALNVQNAIEVAQEKAAKARIDSRRLAVLSELERNNDPDLALILGVLACDSADTYEARSSLVNAVQAKQGPVSLDGDHRSVTGLAYSPDGKTLIVACTGQGTDTKVWDTARGNQLEATYPAVTGVTFSPVGKTLATVNSNGGVVLWDVSDDKWLNPRPLKVYERSDEARVAFSPDGSRLVTYDRGGEVLLWDVAGGKYGNPMILEGCKDIAYSVQFKPDGTILAAGYDDDGKAAVLWDVGSGKQSKRIPLDLPRGRKMVDLSKDGKILAIGNDFHVDNGGRDVGTVGCTMLLSVDSGKRLSPLPLRLGSVINLLFGPDGSKLAVMYGGDRDHDSVKDVLVWDVKWNKQLVVAHLDPKDVAVRGVAFSHDGKRMAVASGNGKVRLWTLDDSESTVMPADSVVAVAFSPDGKSQLLATGNGRDVNLWKLADGKKLKAPSFKVEGSVVSVAFYPEGNRVATGNEKGAVALWDVATGNPRANAFPLAENAGIALSLAFSSDGKKLAVVHAGNRVVLWDVEGKVKLAEESMTWGSGSSSVAFSPDGAALATGYSVAMKGVQRGGVVLWTVASQKLSQTTLLEVSEGRVYSVAYSKDGKTLAAGYQTEVGLSGGVVLWSVANGLRLSSPLTITEGRVVSLAFSPDDEDLATGFIRPSSISGGVVLVPASPRRWRVRAEEIAKRNLTRAEWKRYFPDKPDYTQTFKSLPKPPVESREKPPPRTPKEDGGAQSKK